MTFPKSRIISTYQLIQQIKESNRNGERFCFILGSGASVESNIPTGNDLEMRWMNCIMGEASDLETPPMNAADMRKCAANLYEDHLIEHKFEEIEAAWQDAKDKKKSISSAYYFDIYKLRFYPNPRNGYRYLERIMENCEPSLGYHSLALFLSSSMHNNLVITTNFDSLVEDALFLYTDKRPLVVSHESLASYIESDIQRPIIAKVHRGLMYAPFNSPDTTNELKKEWREALNYALNTYTPIVIGYGGGDHSLMAFLEEETTTIRHGVYWCYRESSGIPHENIQKFVKNKDGYFVAISGFDALMMEIGNALYQEEITPTGTAAYLEKQHTERIRQYIKQWDELNKKPELQDVLQPINEAEQSEERKREEQNELTPWDYIRRGNRAYQKEDYQTAIAEYSQAIALRGDVATDYNDRGCAYSSLGDQLQSTEAYENAIKDFSEAIRLDPYLEEAYNNRGYSYICLGECKQTSAFLSNALADINFAISLSPNNADFHHNLGYIYLNSGQNDDAIKAFNEIIRLVPNDETAYCRRGKAFFANGDVTTAIEDYSKAIALNPEYKEAYLTRANAYRAINEDALAELDENIAAKL